MRSVRFQALVNPAIVYAVAGGGCERQQGFAVVAALKHYWMPTLSSAFYANYMQEYYSSNAQYGAGGGVGAQNFRDIRAGANLIWTPVKGFDIGGEFMFIRDINSGPAVSGNQFFKGLTGLPAGAVGPAYQASQNIYGVHSPHNIIAQEDAIRNTVVGGRKDRTSATANSALGMANQSSGSKVSSAIPARPDPVATSSPLFSLLATPPSMTTSSSSSSNRNGGMASTSTLSTFLFPDRYLQDQKRPGRIVMLTDLAVYCPRFELNDRNHGKLHIDSHITSFAASNDIGSNFDIHKVTILKKDGTDADNASVATLTTYLHTSSHNP